MFRPPYQESTAKKIILENVSGTSLHSLVNYIYTGEIIISEENVEDILHAADFLQLVSVKDSCAKFIQENLNLSNCVKVYMLADLYQCFMLKKHAEDFIKEKFNEVLENDEFLMLQFKQLMRFLSCVNSICHEETIYKAVIQWVNYDPQMRTTFLTAIMSCIQFVYIRQEYLLKIMKDEPLSTNDQCKDLVKEALLVQNHEIAFVLPKPRLRPLQLFIWDGRTDEIVKELYNIQKECSKILANPDEVRWDHGVGVIAGKIYTIGGDVNGSISKTCAVYNSSTDTWSPLANMETTRKGHGVAVINDSIYAVGGHDDSYHCLNTCEIYDPTSNNWKNIKSMLVSRWGVGVGVIKNKIYAVGGDDGISPNNSVEKYDPDEDSWTHISLMPTAVQYAGIGVINDRLYVVGGRNIRGGSPIKTVLRYDIETDNWIRVSDMIMGRQGHSVVVGNGLLYAIGGENADEILLTSIEVYNPLDNTWTMLPWHMDLERAYMGVAIIPTWQ